MLRRAKCVVGRESNVTFELYPLSSHTYLQSFAQTVDCYNDQRLLRLASNEILPPNQGRWKKLVLTDDSRCDLLESPSIVMFQNLEVNYLSPEADTYDDENYYENIDACCISEQMMLRLRNLARTGLLGFSFRFLGMEYDQVLTIKDMLQSNSVRELALDTIIFAAEPDDDDAVLTLTEGIQACLTIDYPLTTTQTFLETLDLRNLDLAEMCTLIRSLQGLPHLKTLRVDTVVGEQEDAALQAIMDVLEDSRCEINDLYFKTKREAMPDYSRLWKILESNNNLRRIHLDFLLDYWLDSDDMIQLLHSVMRQESSILHLNLIGAVMPELPESSGKASIMLPCGPRCCIRSISFTGWLFLGRPFDGITFFETCRTNIQSL